MNTTSKAGRKFGLLDKLLLRWIAFPLMTRAMRRSGTHFYRYDADSDLLLAICSFGRHSKRIFEKRRPNVDWLDCFDRLRIDGGIVFDVGGGLGYTAGLFAGRASRVFVFEPVPANLRMIEEHLRIRRLSNVEIIPAAMSDANAETTLHLKGVWAHHSLGDVGASPTVEVMKVRTQTVDDFAASRGIQTIELLKIDVEGFEPEVLNGASQFLRQSRIATVLFEWSPRFYRQRGIPLDQPLEILRDHGYRVTDLGGADFVFDPEDGRQRDLLAFPPGHKF